MATFPCIMGGIFLKLTWFVNNLDTLKLVKEFCYNHLLAHVAYILDGSTYGFASGNRHTKVMDVICRGTESSLAKCFYRTCSGACYWYGERAIGVYCAPSKDI